MNRWDTLTMGEKNQLLGIYASKGYNNLANIIAHYNSFAEGGNVDSKGDDIDNRTGKPKYRRDIQGVNITSSSNSNIEGAARDTSTIGPLAFYPPKYYIGKQGNQFEENPNVTYDSWFDEHPEMIDVMTDIVGRYNNRLNNRGQQLPQLNRFYFEKLYNPEDDPIIHEAIERMLQAKWNRDVRTYNDNRTLNLWDTVEKFPAANMRVDNEYQRGGKINLDLTVPGTTPETSSTNVVYPVIKKKPIEQPRHKYDDKNRKIIKVNNSNNGGYSERDLVKNENLLKRWNPTGDFTIVNWFQDLLKGNDASGEENNYYKTYLGLGSLPPMNPNAQTEWDYEIEKQKEREGIAPSDFYGTTPIMDKNIQSVLDTLNLGKIVRGERPFHYTEDIGTKEIKRMYEEGKRILENPNKWNQINFDEVKPLGYGYNEYTKEANPLGMFHKAGIKWVPEEKAIYVHDTYDFPNTLFKPVRTVTGIKERPREMKIRGRVNFDPEKGSVLFNEYDGYSEGGKLGHITPYGQWQYPHQVTTIPSNNITMRGVDYPVVGISNTGDVKYMLPNMDYLYDGNYVTEYPVQ